MKHHKKKDYSTLWVVGITIIFTILIIVGVSLSEKNKVASFNLKASQLQTLESEYDFGSISMAQGKVTKVFTFKNNTTEAITAKKLYTSCMCTKATLIKSDKTFGPFGMPAHGVIPGINESIAPGEEAQIEVVFDPAAHGPAGVGPIGRQATLETSDGQLVFKFKANVTP
jgi:hypothetical protein